LIKDFQFHVSSSFYMVSVIENSKKSWNIKLIQFYLINHGWGMPSCPTIGILILISWKKWHYYLYKMLVQKWLWNNTKQIRDRLCDALLQRSIDEKKGDIYDVNQTCFLLRLVFFFHFCDGALVVITSKKI
jgi:hypothetical protein